MEVARQFTQRYAKEQTFVKLKKVCYFTALLAIIRCIPYIDLLIQAR